MKPKNEFMNKLELLLRKLQLKLPIKFSFNSSDMGEGGFEIELISDYLGEKFKVYYGQTELTTRQASDFGYWLNQNLSNSGFEFYLLSYSRHETQVYVYKFSDTLKNTGSQSKEYTDVLELINDFLLESGLVKL